MTTEPNRGPEPLDARLRELVADAVSASPPAPDLPGGDVRVAPLASARRRGLVLAGLGVAAAAVAAAVVWVGHDNGPRLVGASTTGPATTTPLPWPAEVAVTVASDRGIDRVTLQANQRVVTRVVSDVKASRAFELADGSIVYQSTSSTGFRDGIYLRQPSGDTKGPLFEGQKVTLEDADQRPDGLVVFTYSQRRADNQSQPLWFGVGAFMDSDPILFEGPRGNQLPGQLDRTTLVSPEKFVQGQADDLLVRSASTYDLQGNFVSRIEGAAEAARVVADGSFNVGMLAADGTLSTSGRRAQQFGRVLPPDAVVDDVTDLDLRGNWLLVSLRNRPAVLRDLSSGAVYEVPLVDGRATIVRSQRLGEWLLGDDPAPVDPTSTSSMVAATTTIPAVVYNPGTCMNFTTSAAQPFVVQVGNYGFYSLYPIPSEPITVDGRPAVLQSWGGGLSVVLGAPYWCSTLAFTVNPPADGSPVDKAAFLAWLATVDVVERLPEGMRPVVLAGPSGVAVVGQQGTTTVTTKPAFRAVLLADGDVVWQELGSDPSTGGYRPELTHLWNAVTGAHTELWAAVDWVAPPVLHDALPDGRFAWSVSDRLVISDPLGVESQSVALGLTPGGRLSVNLRDQLVAGEGLYMTIDQAELSAAPATPDFWQCTSACAFEMDGRTAVVASATDLRVVDRSTGETLFGMPWGDNVITDVDIRGNWLSYYASPLGDSDSTVRVMDYTTGVGLAFQGWRSAHFSRTP